MSLLAQNIYSGPLIYTQLITHTCMQTNIFLASNHSLSDGSIDDSSLVNNPCNKEKDLDTNFL